MMPIIIKLSDLETNFFIYYIKYVNFLYTFSFLAKIGGRLNKFLNGKIFADKIVLQQQT